MKGYELTCARDGDMIRNGVAMSEQGTYPLPLGYDRYTNVEFANKTFILNAINYLAGDEGMIEARPRNIAIRRLDLVKAKDRRTYFQVMTMVLPVASVLLLAAVVIGVRKWKYNNQRNRKK